MLTACVTREPDKSAEPADSCVEWEDDGWLPVASETSACPDPSAVDGAQIDRWQWCDGDEVTAILDRVSDAPSPCAYLLMCDWSCAYHVRVRNCASEPMGCRVI